MTASVLTGLDRLVGESFARLRGRKVGLLAHPASVDRDLRHAVYLMHAAGVSITALFGPEHGVTGDLQDMEPAEEEETARDNLTGARLYSLYGTRFESLRPSRAMLADLDVLVVDLQDVGARYYTFAATMGYAMEVAAELGLEVMVLDRPNPLGGREQDIEGPRLEDGFRSFVGAYQMPIRHGLTLGEYARAVMEEKKLDLDLEVISMLGWQRSMDFEATGLPWVMPSPNMPTVDTAWVYPGQCLLEGTNLSEGRGTTRPFELCGAPYLDGVAWALRAGPHVGPGVVLRPTYIRPMFQKHAGLRCGAVQLHVTDRWAVRSLRTTIALLEAARALERELFAWRTDAYEFVSDRAAIDLLFGSDRPRRLLEEGAAAEEVARTFEADERAFAERRRPWLMYD
ncbi:MAG: DUF1343 domain-containing protein [Deltaproteobacteria bacterium]|nr:DUF1343 domain-containing protein [Deltaproteobacteria bacterium]